jgi:hypothetical protein
MSNPRCVLCGEEFEVETFKSCEGDITYFIEHECYGQEYSFNYEYDHDYQTKAAALAAIPERFVMKEE